MPRADEKALHPFDALTAGFEGQRPTLVGTEHVALEARAGARSIRVYRASCLNEAGAGLRQHVLGSNRARLGAQQREPRRLALFERDVLEERSVAAQAAADAKLAGCVAQPLKWIPISVSTPNRVDGPSSRRPGKVGVRTSSVTCEGEGKTGAASSSAPLSQNPAIGT